MSEVWCLLGRNISKWQLIGYGLANIIGLSVIFAGILFYCDSRYSGSDEDRYFSNDYIVLSKRVEGIGFKPVSFSEEEIEKLGNEKWVNRIGCFTSSRFAVSGSIDMGGRLLSTYLFFESVPDEFFDIIPKNWYFKPEDKFVPIILSKDYLALYNFGFAAPHGLPQLSEEVIGAVPIALRLTGENQVAENYTAAIVGFSSRLNTIAVPQSFMDWANERYARGEAPNPSRLIVDIDRLKSSDMAEYLEQENLEIGGDKSESGKISSFLGTVSVVVSAGGAVMCVLAVFILLLSLFLLLQKSRKTLRNFMLLGYSPRELGRYYEYSVFIINAGITIISVAIASYCRGSWLRQLKELDLGESSIGPVIMAAIVYLFLVSVVNTYIIRSHLIKIWRDQ